MLPVTITYADIGRLLRENDQLRERIDELKETNGLLKEKIASQESIASDKQRQKGPDVKEEEEQS